MAKELTKQEIEAKQCPGCSGKLQVVKGIRTECRCEDCEATGQGASPHAAYMSLFNKMW